MVPFCFLFDIFDFVLMLKCGLFTLPLSLNVTSLPPPNTTDFFIYNAIFSSAPTSVINNDCLVRPCKLNKAKSIRIPSSNDSENRIVNKGGLAKYYPRILFQSQIDG